MSEFLYVNGRLKRTQEQQVSGDKYIAYSSDIDYNNSNYNVHNVQEAINKLFEEIESLKNNNPNPPVEKYTVTFKSNGGIGTTPSSITVNSGSSISLPGSSGLTKEGYTFDNWNENSEGTGTKLHEGDSYTVTKNTTLYAIWKKDTTYYWYVGITKPRSLSDASTVESYSAQQTFTNPSTTEKNYIHVLTNSDKIVNFYDPSDLSTPSTKSEDITTIPGYKITSMTVRIAKGGTQVIKIS